jgi:hypothetical protein
LIAVLWLLVRVEQYVFRSRAERLHAEILALQLHPGSFADIQRLRREWGAHSHYNGPCTQHHCIYEITVYDGLDDWFRKPPDPFPHFGAMRSLFLLKAYAFFGGRPGYADANVRVRDDRMWGADFGLGVVTYPGVGRNKGYPYEVLAGTDSGSRLSRRGDLNLRDLRRGFRVDAELNCLGCEYVGVHVTPQTDARDVERFNHFNFNCITAILACKHPVDFLPEAWNQALKDKLDQSDSNQPACGLPTRILARETNDVVLAKVLSINDSLSSGGSERYQKVKVQVLETPKNGEDFRKSNQPLFVPTAGALRPEISSDSARLSVGQDYFFIFNFWRPSPYPMVIDLRPEPGTYLEPCHALANIPANAASIREGIALDPSNGEPYDFRNETHTEK